MDEQNERLPHISQVSSAAECTGLMQTVPDNDEEYAAYQTLFALEIPLIEDEADDRRPQGGATVNNAPPL